MARGKQRIYLAYILLTGLLPNLVISQISSINGEIRYNHQFISLKSGKNYHSLNRRNPDFNIMSTGYLLSPSLLSFSVNSSVNANYSTIKSLLSQYSSKNYYFNFYNIHVDALPNYIFQINFGARESETEATTNFSLFTKDIIIQKQRNQNLTFTTDRIVFLPRTQISFLRTRQWSEYFLQPFDQVSEVLNVNLSKSTNNSSFNLSGSFNRSFEKYTRIEFVQQRIGIAGEKKITSTHVLHFNSELNRYPNVDWLNANLIYNGQVSEKSFTTATLFANNFLTINTSSSSIGYNQNLQYRLSENYALSLGGNVGKLKNIIKFDGIIDRKETIHYGISSSLAYARTLKLLNFSNSISTSFGRRKGDEPSDNLSLGLNNFIGTKIQSLDFSINQSSNFDRITGIFGREELYNSLALNASGTLWRIITSNSISEIRDERVYKNNYYNRNARYFKFQQLFSTYITYIISIQLSIGGNLQYNFTPYRHSIYSINANISSHEFFIRNLSLNYRIEFTKNAFYRSNIFNQFLELFYTWRALTFQLRYQEYRFNDTRRDVWLTITRSFSIINR